MTIRTKLFFLAALPLLAVLALGLYVYRGNAEVAQEMRSIDALSQLAVRMSALVHETQKERGRTAGFLGIQGTKFAQELGDQRNLTDQRIAELDAFLADFDPAAYSVEFDRYLNDALADLKQIGQTRQAVSQLNIPAKQAIGYYTQMNGRFLDGIGCMAEQTHDGDLTRVITAYVLFLKGKERAGIERAVLSNTFAADAFGPGMYAKFIGLVTEQNTYIAEFRALASPDAVAFLDKASGDGSFRMVQQYRDLASERAITGKFETDAGQWFATITQKINKLKEVEDYLSDSLRAKSLAAASTASGATLVIGGAVAAVLVICVAVGMWTMRSINRPLKQLIERIEHIQASNDLSVRLNDKGRTEIDALARCCNGFIGTLGHIISGVRNSSSEVAAAATEVAACGEELTSGMDSQHGQIQSISAAIEEMSASVVEVARRASEAAGEAENAGRVANTGQSVVQKTVEGMATIRTAVSHSAQAVTELGKRGEQIGQIIAVINDIADQTNLLALNAAIEAARAGEHGRGFAVVADEVRKLADRTTQATDEIATSITAIQQETTTAVERMDSGTQQVQVGVDAATEAGSSLEQIVASAQDLNGKIQSIAAAAEQQSTASQEIASGIESINAVTAQSLEGSRQAAKAAAHLSCKAEELREMVDRFKTAA